MSAKRPHQVTQRQRAMLSALILESPHQWVYGWDLEAMLPHRELREIWRTAQSLVQNGYCKFDRDMWRINQFGQRVAANWRIKLTDKGYYA